MSPKRKLHEACGLLLALSEKGNDENAAVALIFEMLSIQGLLTAS